VVVRIRAFIEHNRSLRADGFSGDFSNARNQRAGAPTHLNVTSVQKLPSSPLAILRNRQRDCGNRGAPVRRPSWH